MLQAMRDGAKSKFIKFIFMGLMAMAVFGLVLMDVGGVFRGGVAPTNIASIDGQELPVRVFDRTVQSTLAQQGLDTETAYRLGFIDRLLRSEIQRNLLQQAASDYGLRVSDSLVANQVKSLISPYVTDNVTREQALQGILRAQGMSEGQLVRTIRNEMSTNILRSALSAGASAIPDFEIDALYKFQYESREIEVIILPNERITDLEKPGDNVLRPLYEAGQERFAISEARTFTMAILNESMLKETLEIAEEELRAIYERDIETYKLPEQRVVEQAIFENQNTAQAVADKAIQDTALEEAVESETGDKDAYTGEETFEEQGLPDEIAAPVFTASEDTVVGPVETALGWHVMHVREIQPPRTQPFEEVKDILERQVMNERLADEMFMTANMIDDRLASGDTVEAVAEAMDLKLETYGPVRADGSTPEQTDGLKELNSEDRALILQTAFEMNEGEASPVIELSDGRFITVRVDSITPRSYKPFENVRSDLADQWRKNQQAAENKSAAGDFVQALRKGETTLGDIAARTQDAGRERFTLKRAEDPPEALGDRAKTAAFSLPVQSYALAEVGGGYAIIFVESITIPHNIDRESEQYESIRAAVRRSIQAEVQELYLGHLWNRHDIDINERLLETTYGPSGDSF